MSAPFLTPDFLLDTPQAVRLYHEYAADLQIIDYHCHLDPAVIARDHRFADLAEIWLGGDHYKWRAMRTNGVAERFCTGVRLSFFGPDSYPKSGDTLSSGPSAATSPPC